MFEDNRAKWTDDYFDRMRNTGDPPADQIVEAIFAKGEVHAVNRTLVALTQNDQELPESLPSEVHEYFAQTAKLPDWADPNLIKLGEDLFTDYGMMAFSILGCASLPECYSCALGAKVLSLTSQLEDHINRRIVETFLMVVDVMTEGGLAAGGKGIRSAQKVRLMHASIRHLILHRQAADESREKPKTFADVLGQVNWNAEKDGYPINQETMGLTLLSFSYAILRSLAILGVKVEKERQDAYFHCWNVIGHIMGVDPAFYVDTMADGETLWQLLYRRMHQASPEGRHLNDDLMNYLGSQIKSGIPLGWLMPANHIPRWLTRKLVGVESAEILGIHWGFLDRVGTWVLSISMFLLGFIEKDIYQDLPKGHRVAEWLFRELAQSEMKRGGSRPPYQIQDSLRGCWKLK